MPRAVSLACARIRRNSPSALISSQLIALFDSIAAPEADQVLDGILQATEALRTLPDRGSCPNELRSLGISEYRQVLFKPYPLIYRVHAQLVVIYVVADGRRDMQSLLMRRLLGA
jgi:toxin ParE1/3/4